MKGVGVGGDEWSVLVAEAGVAFLNNRRGYQPLADFLFGEISSAWYPVRGFFMQRMRAGDNGEPLPDPAELIDALNELHMRSAAFMWIYMKVQDPALILGDAAAISEFKRQITEGPVS